MKVEKRSLNWFPKQSAWSLAESRREKRKAASEAFIATNDSLASAVQSSRDNLTMGMAEIIGKIAAARVQADVKAKFGSATAGMTVDAEA